MTPADKKREYMRKYRKTHRAEIAESLRKWKAANADRVAAYEAKRPIRLAKNRSSPEQIKARTAVFHALEAGRIAKKPCERCGASKVQGHHEDYSKPLDVVWLCPSCHTLRHKELEAAA